MIASVTSKSAENFAEAKEDAKPTRQGQETRPSVAALCLMSGSTEAGVINSLLLLVVYKYCLSEV